MQIPKLVRWRFKLKTDQILKAAVSVFGVWGTPESYLSRISKDRRIAYPN